MTIMSQLAVIFAICLLSQGISAILPFSFPASVISMILLLLFLLTGLVKSRHIDQASGFLVRNMSFFFLAPCVGLIDHAAVLRNCLVPFLLISILTTPLVYVVTAWTVQIVARLLARKENNHD